ncbi:15-hydroxyprostaglandin dehydrogenase [NAD(+)] [Esox lucius]|uniref:15-hydroxyprostaglandin dehydrogenase [NAD(+)] n=1 Tax=Esox lucius TaxID=8010 RepID=A0AAY5L2I6_ESOLU|nr:15-hydroxyprostaglandin dehydrogenase [NAD(+)] [Esox lucius]
MICTYSRCLLIPFVKCSSSVSGPVRLLSYLTTLMMALHGKVALVTGAAQGLGKGFSEILLQNGAKVALLDVNEKGGKVLKAAFDKEYGPDRTLLLTCTVESEEQLKDAFQKTVDTFGGLDIVCNNAGIVNENNWEKCVSINLNGVVRGTYLALQHMKKENGGRGGVIVNVSSLAGLGPLLTAPIYTATKHGVVGFSRAMADASSVCDYGVRINMLCPSFADTSLLTCLTSDETAGQFISLRGVAEKMKDQFGVLEVSVVAENFLKLVTDESRNGEALMVQMQGASYVTFPKMSA